MPSFLKTLRKLPVKEEIKDIATFINRELVPFINELKGQVNDDSESDDEDISDLQNEPFVTTVLSPTLTNESVATGSTEIAIGLAASAISWSLNTASVVLSKLADLAGLSVLGRATNSSGVMAAITSTAANQKLVSNTTGTSIGWVSDLPTVFNDTVTGVLTDYKLPVGFRSGDTVRLTITGNTTINSIVDSAGATVPEGTILYLCLSDQSGG